MCAQTYFLEGVIFMRSKRTIFRLVVLDVINIALGSAFYGAYANDDSPVKIAP